MPRRVLVCDFGRNMGDNCRGFLLLKAFVQTQRDLEVACWLTPGIEAILGEMLEAALPGVRFLVSERGPRRTYEMNHDILKQMISTGRPFVWSSCPGGRGPDGERYDFVVPTGEPWFTAKLLRGESLDSPETINHGQFLAGLLGVDELDVAAALPLFGRRWPDVQGPVTVGLCRPTPDDPKQLPESRRQRIWRELQDTGRQLVAVDWQDWSPPPPTAADMRALLLPEKVEVFNRAWRHVGLDGGLVHFAAACGCPTLAFYAGPGDDSGRVFGPWPRLTPWGEHEYHNNFKSMIEAIANRLRTPGAGSP